MIGIDPVGNRYIGYYNYTCPSYNFVPFLPGGGGDHLAQAVKYYSADYFNYFQKLLHDWTATSARFLWRCVVFQMLVCSIPTPCQWWPLKLRVFRNVHIEGMLQRVWRLFEVQIQRRIRICRSIKMKGDRILRYERSKIISWLRYSIDRASRRLNDNKNIYDKDSNSLNVDSKATLRICTYVLILLWN